MPGRERPLSPHLQIYRFQWPMALSILHRATGLGLGLALGFLAWWLAAAAAGAEAFTAAQAFASSYLGRTLFLAVTFSTAYHLCNGVRHLGWDLGVGLGPRAARSSGWAVFVGSIALTAAVLVGGLALRGGV